MWGINYSFGQHSLVNVMFRLSAVVLKRYLHWSQIMFGFSFIQYTLIIICDQHKYHYNTLWQQGSDTRLVACAVVWQYFSDSDSDSETWNSTSPLRFTCGLPDCDCLRVSHSPPPVSHPVSGTVFNFLATTHSHVSMADTTLPRPTMDWSASDHAQALWDFQQLCKMWFTLTVTHTEAAAQHKYIMLWLGSIGFRLLNSWSLTEEQLQDPKTI